jgi:hypothetical protein
MFSVAAAGAAFAQQGSKPTGATFISEDEIKAVAALKANDRTLKVADVGSENLAIGYVHRNSTVAAAGRGGGGRGRADVPPAERCGTQEPNASGPNGTTHDSQTETYYILSGAGTLATGGHIVNGRKSAADSDTVKVLNGPSCGGTMVGADIVKREVKVGDIVIIPTNVPHVWLEIPDHLDYIVFRPSGRVLQAGYVDPVIRGKE